MQNKLTSPNPLLLGSRVTSSNLKKSGNIIELFFDDEIEMCKMLHNANGYVPFGSLTCCRSSFGSLGAISQKKNGCKISQKKMKGWIAPTVQKKTDAENYYSIFKKKDSHSEDW